MVKKHLTEISATTCIYHPHVSCTGNIEILKQIKESDPLSKVFLKTKDANTEWSIAKELYTLDPLQEYFVYPTQYCSVDTKQLPKPKSNCKLPVKLPKTLIQLSMKYVPKTIMDYSSHQKITAKWFIKSIYHILEGLEKLHQFGYIHNDIKYNNVMVDKDGHCKLIDFGISQPKKEYYNLKNNSILYTDYMIHPPETRYYMRYYFLEKKIESIEDFIQNEWYLLHYIITETHQSNIELYKGYYTYDLFKKELQNLYTSLQSYSKGHLKKVLQKHVEKTDIYSLGVMLTHIFPCTPMVPHTSCSLYIYNLIQHMIHPNLFKRWTVKQCKDYVHKALIAQDEQI